MAPLNDFAARLVWGLLIGLMCVAAGCSGKTPTMRQRLGMLPDGRLDGPVRESLEAVGGPDLWDRLVRIDADALVTLFEQDSGRTLIEQHHEVTMGDDGFSVTSVTHEPTGQLRERLQGESAVEVELQRAGSNSQQTDPAILMDAAVRLRIIAQAMTGSAGLLCADLDLRYVHLENKGGRLMHRIEGTGNLLGHDESRGSPFADLLVVWIDADSAQLNRLWLRYPDTAQESGGFRYMAANVSDYRKLPDGIVVPGRIELIRSDEMQQFSERRVMLIEYRRIQAQVEPEQTPKRFIFF